MTALPPGPAFIIRLALPPILSVLAVYALLIALEGHTYKLSTSTTCAFLVGAFLARPIWRLLFFQHYANFRDTRRAAENGAVMPPLVEGSSSEVVSAVVRSFGDGYIGQSFFIIQSTKQ